MDRKMRRKLQLLKNADLIGTVGICVCAVVLAASLSCIALPTATAASGIKVCCFRTGGRLVLGSLASIAVAKHIFQAVSRITKQYSSEAPIFSGVRLLFGMHRPSGNGNTGRRTVAQAKYQNAAKSTHGNGVYNMVRSPRGLCIIINNMNFEGSSTRRHGAEHDMSQMVDLFNALHFDCIVACDMKASDMKALLSDAARSEDQWAADCLVVILMSHGKQDTIRGADGKQLHLADDVYGLFNNENCPALRGKPKLFFIQACRGDKQDNATGTARYESADAEPIRAEVLEPVLSPSHDRMATWSDMYIAYATIPGYRALRHSTIGSWFLSAIYKVFTQHASTMHLEELMHCVQDEVMSQSSPDGAKQTPNVELRGWRKKLYFNP